MLLLWLELSGAGLDELCVGAELEELCVDGSLDGVVESDDTTDECELPLISLDPLDIVICGHVSINRAL